MVLPYLCVSICRFELKLRDGFSHPFLNCHPKDLHDGQGVIHGVYGDVKCLAHLGQEEKLPLPNSAFQECDFTARAQRSPVWVSSFQPCLSC